MIYELIKLLISYIIGLLVGNERQKNHKPIGTRTIAILTVSSTLLTIIILRFCPYDTARIMSGIITGIGFLGAGSIIAEGKTVKGHTTAVLVWAMSIIGIGIGIGEFFLSIISSFLIYVTLIMNDKNK